MTYMNICIVAGARPNFIKVAPILHAASQAKEAGKPVDYLLVLFRNSISGVRSYQNQWNQGC